ncbi:MAG: hypothetical protein ACTSPY_12245 [Candidatus Helarchaeota archaeon]
MSETNDDEIKDTVKKIHKVTDLEEKKIENKIVSEIDHMENEIENICCEEIDILKKKCNDFEEIINNKGKSIQLD